MRWWGWFFIIVGIVTYFLPEIGMNTIGRPIVFLPFSILGENAIYAHGGSVAFGFLLLFASYFSRD